MSDWMKKVRNKIREPEKEAKIKVKIVADGWLLQKDGKTEYIRR